MNEANGNDWLQINDRRAPAVTDESLPVADRLTEQRRHAANQQQRLGAEMARFAGAAQRLLPEGTPIPGAAQTQRLARRLFGPLLPADTLVNADFWRGAAYVLAYLLRSQARSAERRLTGDYTLDDFGLDEGFLGVVLPLAQFMFQSYWRVEVTGDEHVPAAGRALLVSNHSGVLPFDGAMIGLAIHNSPVRRLPRSLVASWFPGLPFVSMLLQKTGQVQAHPLNAQHLLERDELVVVFPEGIKGVGKPFRDRYQLQRFGRGGFIKTALQSRAPIIPVAVVGAEEIYPMLGSVPPLARLLGLPYFPLTPTWPWLGPLGLAPLPTKWTIAFGPPIAMDCYAATDAANPALVAQLTDQVRMTIQQMLLEHLARRRSIFRG
ncbi:MAG: lysophospholipid acyltransferase family protein [Caldilineales bacterium]